MSLVKRHLVMILKVYLHPHRMKHHYTAFKDILRLMSKRGQPSHLISDDYQVIPDEEEHLFRNAMSN